MGTPVRQDDRRAGLMRLPRPLQHAEPSAERGPRARRRIPTFLLALLLAAFGVSAGLGLTLTGRADDEPSPSASLSALRQRAGHLIVYSEFGEWADALWAADPDDPTDRTYLGRVEHARGYGITPQLSPDGAQIALTVLPPGESSAELWVITTETGAAQRLAQGVDLLAGPVWSPANDAVVVRRSAQGEATGTELLHVDLAGNQTTVASSPDGLYAIDFSPDGAYVYFAALSSAGTDLVRAPVAGGTPQAVAHLSDGFARDWHLSPDGGRLAYLAETPEEAGVAYVAQVLDLATGAAQTLDAVAGVAQYNPVWDAAGDVTVGHSTMAGGAVARVAVEDAATAAVSRARLPGPEAGFDVPLSWSPDGAYLIVRSFAGASGADPGPSNVAVVGVDGVRRELSALSDIAIAGWLEPPA